MAFRKADVSAPLDKVRFFNGSQQVFEAATSRAFNPGDVVELYGRQYTIQSEVPVFDLVTGGNSINVTLAPLAG